MAYAAVISLKQTIHRLLNSSHTPIASSSREILEFASKQITSLQEFLKEFYQINNKRWNAKSQKPYKKQKTPSNPITFSLYPKIYTPLSKPWRK
ncbi:putative late blight resistance protein R1B-17 [Salvia divinorum]|uniref:Late blight resistance protein R1B-17 n=1 Tax=Salvia divinorum TaxID=28513 RepID=A0ABD1HFS9_SALDI